MKFCHAIQHYHEHSFYSWACRFSPGHIVPSVVHTGYFEHVPMGSTREPFHPCLGTWLHEMSALQGAFWPRSCGARTVHHRTQPWTCQIFQYMLWLIHSVRSAKFFFELTDNLQSPKITHELSAEIVGHADCPTPMGRDEFKLP